MCVPTLFGRKPTYKLVAGGMLQYLACYIHTVVQQYDTAVLYFRPCMHAASGLLSSSMELLAFANRHFAPKIVDLSVCFIRNLSDSSL